jgi:hypothetical protein
MLRTYAARVEGAVDADVEAIKRSMNWVPGAKGPDASSTECSRREPIERPDEFF